MGSIVFCIHHKDGCKWSDELRKLKVCSNHLHTVIFIFSDVIDLYLCILFNFQAHLNTCKHDAVSCNNKCGAMIPHLLMEDHLKYTCAQRRTRCDFCAKDGTGETLEVF